MTLADTIIDVKAKALVDTMADRLEQAKSGTNRDNVGHFRERQWSTLMRRER